MLTLSLDFSLLPSHSFFSISTFALFFLSLLSLSLYHSVSSSLSFSRHIPLSLHSLPSFITIYLFTLSVSLFTISFLLSFPWLSFSWHSLSLSSCLLPLSPLSLLSTPSLSVPEGMDRIQIRPRRTDRIRSKSGSILENVSVN
jgi:hypothetical protein